MYLDACNTLIHEVVHGFGMLHRVTERETWFDGLTIKGKLPYIYEGEDDNDNTSNLMSYSTDKRIDIDVMQALMVHLSTILQ